MKKTILIMLTLAAVSCNVKDEELQRLEKEQVQLYEKQIEDSIRFERIERLVNAGMTYEEAKQKVDSIYNLNK